MSLEVVEADGRLRRFVVKLARRLFGNEAYWVERGFRWEPEWVRTLVLLVDGTPVGFNQVYVWPCCGVMMGVHHYIGVEPGFQGRGFGKILLASGEEVLREMGAEVFSATLRAGNVRSRKLLESMGYHIYTWNELNKKLGEELVDELLYTTGGYSDELVALKDALEPWREPLARLVGRRVARQV